MENYNYYETLSKTQKLKWEEKLGNLCYKEWFDTLFEDFTLEESGAILLSIMFYDKTGGTQPLPEKLEKIIDSDRAIKTIYRTYMEKTAAATKDWINKHKLKNIPEKVDIIEIKSQDETKNTTIIKTTYQIKHKEQEATFELKCEYDKVKNLPTLQDFQEFLQSISDCNDADGTDEMYRLSQIIAKGNEDLWQKDIYTYDIG